eukprot:gb/GECH01002922.1/.p1 GENE.gb/GECH01002922.1/~~gb/GECH01002922.1/.p1  ORF type:complete len:627 (+),score=196.88 gb/GECH01002922.1/:1-1881(+)
MDSNAVREAEILDRKLHGTYEGIKEVRESLRMGHEQDSSINASGQSFNDTSRQSNEDAMIEDSVDVFQRLLNSGLNIEHKMAKKRKDLEAEFRPEISKRSQKIKRRESVEDHLMKMRGAYNAKMDQMRRHKEHEEICQIRSPTINKTSSSLQRKEPAYDRLYSSYKQMSAKKQLKKEELKRKEMEEHSGHPEINRISQKLDRNVDQRYAWQEQKEQNQERLKQQLDEMEKLKCRGVKINKKSRELAEKMGRKERVEDHLLYLHNRSMQKRELQKALTEEQEQLQATPRINRKASPKRSEKNVSERLYSEALESAEKKRNQAKEYEDSISSVDPDTGEKLYHPNINPKSSKIKRNIPVQELLYQKHLEREAKKQEVQEERWKEIENNKLKIGPVSALLAQIVEERTHTPSKDRIYQPIHQLKQQKQQELDDEERKNMTFRPSINPNSVSIDKNVNKNSDRREFLSKKAEEYNRKRERMQKEREENELAECTFSPNPEKPRTPSRMTLLDRNTQWLSKVNSRMEKERQEAQAKKLEECTFRPNSSRSFNHTFSGRVRSKSPSATPRSREIEPPMQEQEPRRSFTPPPRRPSNSSHSPSEEQKLRRKGATYGGRQNLRNDSLSSIIAAI